MLITQTKTGAVYDDDDTQKQTRRYSKY